MGYKLRPVKSLIVKPPHVVLARQMEQLMHDAGLPKPYTRDQFGAMHARLYATDEVYREAYDTLMHLTRVRKAVGRAKGMFR